jgi:hypothetical protein
MFIFPTIWNSESAEKFNPVQHQYLKNVKGRLSSNLAKRTLLPSPSPSPPTPHSPLPRGVVFPIENMTSGSYFGNLPSHYPAFSMAY